MNYLSLARFNISAPTIFSWHGPPLLPFSSCSRIGAPQLFIGPTALAAQNPVLGLRYASSRPWGVSRISSSNASGFPNWLALFYTNETTERRTMWAATDPDRWKKRMRKMRKCFMVWIFCAFSFVKRPCCLPYARWPLLNFRKSGQPLCIILSKSGHHQDCTFVRIHLRGFRALRLKTCTLRRWLLSYHDGAHPTR